MLQSTHIGLIKKVINMVKYIIGLNDMDKISYLHIHDSYFSIDAIRYDYGFGENQVFFRKIKRLF